MTVFFRSILYRRLSLAALVVAALVLTACTVPATSADRAAAPPGGTPQPAPTQAPPTQPPAAVATTAPSAGAPLAGTRWLWQSLMMNNDTRMTPDDPQKYTLEFAADGTLSARADCNTASGTYQVDGNRLTIGPLVMTKVACQPGSLSDAYARRLAEMRSFMIQDGKLVLDLPMDSGSLIFASASTQAPATPPASAESGIIQPRQIRLDTQGLPYSWQANLAPATPYVSSQAPGPAGLPQHLEINFGVSNPQDRLPSDPVMYIIPVDAYKQLWDNAGNQAATRMITRVYSLTVALQTPLPTSGLPALPFEQLSGANDLAVQIKRGVNDTSSASRSGYRFVGRWAQDANPVTAETRLWYTYQGFTNDGKYLVSFFYPVTTAKLPKQAEISSAEMATFNSDPQAYLKAQAEMLNAIPPSGWQPDLTQLDKLVGSLQIEGMPGTGLQNTDWQWKGTRWYERTDAGYVTKEKPVANPERYKVIYGEDGTLQVKADCNEASGKYTYNGGMVGRVRVQMEAPSAAACGPDSRATELIQSLQAAQDYRVHPGGTQMQLNMPAGGPMLIFESTGQAPK